MKKLGLFILICTSLFLIAGCDNKKQKNVEGTLEEIMTSVYKDIPEYERPMMLTNTEVNEENIEYYLGTKDIEYKEALASESGVGSIAHSVVLVRTKENSDIEEIKTKIKESINPRKWICVEAEEVEVESKGNLIILIMSSEINTEKIETEFDKL